MEAQLFKKFYNDKSSRWFLSVGISVIKITAYSAKQLIKDENLKHSNTIMNNNGVYQFFSKI